LKTKQAHIEPTDSKEQVIQHLRRIPGVGKSIANDLWELGIRSIADLKHKNPEQMYEAHCEQRGMLVDRCLLYVFRCAVYYASNTKHKSDLLLWWNWKDPA
jgi:hypothetical protein